MLQEKIRVLYVDDNELDRELVRDALEREHGGFELAEAASRQDFDRQLKEQDYDIVLSDLNILGFDGLQVLDAVRASRPGIPVIIVTGTGSEEIAVQAMKQGAADYVVKSPQHMARLPLVIESVLRRKQLEQELQLQEDAYRDLVHQSLQGIVIYQEERIVFANPAFAELVGYPIGELMQMSAEEAWHLVHPEDIAQLMVYHRQRVEGGAPPVRYRHRFLHRDGHVYWVDASVHLIQHRGRNAEQALYVNVTDEVKRQEREQELQQRAQQQEKLAAVGQLAAGIAHDFNNILTGVIGYAEILLMENTLSADQREDAQVISDQGKRAAQLIRQILDFSRQSVIDRKPLDLGVLLKEQIKLLKRIIPESIDIELTGTTGAFTVQADPTQIQQLVMNLAVNARDAMPRGGRMQFHLSRRTFPDVNATPFQEMSPGEWIELSVADTGKGIPPEILDQVFDPFFTTKQVGQGTGLGLAQVYGIIRQHDGFINVSSEVGQGTTFFMYLPASHATGASGLLVQGSLPTSRGETILVAEDDSVVLDLVEKLLRVLGYDVLTARDGEQALATLEEQGDTIDLVLADVVMPRVSGGELHERIAVRHPRMPVLFMSGYPLEERMGEYLHQHRMLWVQKPIALEALAHAVRQAIDQTDS